MRTPPSAQHDLLLQAVVRVAAIEVIGQPAIPARIAIEIGIEQIDRHDVAVAAHQVVAPCAHRHIAAFHRHRDPRGFFRAEVSGIPRLHFFGLIAGLVQMLLEISFAMHQRKRDQRNAKIRCGAQRVSGKHSQAAGVRGHLRLIAISIEKYATRPEVGDVS